MHIGSEKNMKSFMGAWSPEKRFSQSARLQFHERKFMGLAQKPVHRTRTTARAGPVLIRCHADYFVIIFDHLTSQNTQYT